VDYGPPNLNFTNFGALSDGQPVLTRNQSQGGTESVILSRGKHTLTLGAQYSRNDTSTTTQQNGRGTFNFNGEATSELGYNGVPCLGSAQCVPIQGTGFDFADFLLGMPQSASIAIQSGHVFYAECLDRLPAGRLESERESDCEPGPALRVLRAAAGKIQRDGQPGHRSRLH
jgi:trimeric autotransporter adhesin